MSQEFAYKGYTITVNEKGQFQYRLPQGAVVTKPTLKSMQAAIDKEVGIVLVTAMDQNGHKLELLGRHPKGGYIDGQGYQVRRYGGRLYQYNEAVIAKINDLQARRNEESDQHATARRVFDKEEQEILATAVEFQFETALAAKIAEKSATS